MPSLLEAQRQLAVCNACRYCEGLCAVFPALERRPAILTEGDVVYLANLCHDCRSCYQACMYAPPHEFAVDIPRLLSEARTESYRSFARPRFLGRLFSYAGPAAAGWTGLGIVLALAAVWLGGNLGGLLGVHTGPGAFYRVVPFYLMLIPSFLATAYVGAVLAGGLASFWAAAGGRRLSLRGLLGGAADAHRLRYLEGGGGGCYYPDPERPAGARRWLHHLVYWGFAAAFVSTLLAAVWQDVLGVQPPYELATPPVAFGIAGGIAMVIGSSGLLALKAVSARRLADPTLVRMDVAFLVLLNAASVTGLLLLDLRGTPWLGVLLVLHLGVLTGLYATAPYGKFVHFVYRGGALILNRLEQDS